MPATEDNRFLRVGPGGTIFVLTKGPDDRFIIALDFTDWLGGSTTVTGCATPVCLPVDATNAPTLVVTSVASPLVVLTLDAGTALWNSTGQGTASALVTMLNGEKKEVNFLINVLEEPGHLHALPNPGLDFSVSAGSGYLAL